MMEGRIWVESAVGQGSTFHFTARFGVRADARAQPSHAWDSLHACRCWSWTTTRPTDVSWKNNSRSWGMRPTMVDGGPAALAALHQACRQGEPFPLVLLDAHMPSMDGFSVAAQIKQSPSPDTRHHHDADVGRSIQRCGPLPGAGHYVLPHEADQTVRVAERDLHGPPYRLGRSPCYGPAAATRPDAEPASFAYPPGGGQCGQPTPHGMDAAKVGTLRRGGRQRQRGISRLSARDVCARVDGRADVRHGRPGDDSDYSRPGAKPPGPISRSSP